MGQMLFILEVRLNLPLVCLKMKISICLYSDIYLLWTDSFNKAKFYQIDGVTYDIGL